VLTGAEAVSFAAASTLNRSGLVGGRSAPFDADHGGIVEARIGAVIAAAAIALWRGAGRACTAGLLAIGFTIAGFGWGLSTTAQGGHWPDVAYHVTLLLLLPGSFIAVLRFRCGAGPGRGARAG